MNEVLGAGSASRLFLNLREEKGYTYGVYSNLIARKYAGPWTAGGDLRTEVTDGAMTEFLRELNRIRDEKVPEDELDAARRSVVARFALSLESPQQLIGYAITRKTYNFPRRLLGQISGADRGNQSGRRPARGKKNTSIPQRCRWSLSATQARSRRSWKNTARSKW